MNLPKKIKFGHRTIEIRYDAELMPSRNILSTGHTDLGYIKVQPSLSKEVQAGCIFRGILFAIMDICGLEHDGKDRERIGTGILTVIRDNPSLLTVKILDKVRIFGHDWMVVSENEQYDFCGRFVAHEQTLHMNSAYDGTVAWQILWHEILHAIWCKMSVEISDEDDERDVEIISFCLCTLFSQNDFSWVLEEQDAKDHN